MRIRKYSIPSADEIDRIIATFADLDPAPTAREALQLLKKNGWDLWIATNGGYQSTQALLESKDLLNYFRLDGQKDTLNILSCDDLRISKPHPKVYSEVMRLAVHRTQRIEVWERKEMILIVGSYAACIYFGLELLLCFLACLGLGRSEKCVIQDSVSYDWRRRICKGYVQRCRARYTRRLYLGVRREIDGTGKDQEVLSVNKTGVALSLSSASLLLLLLLMEIPHLVSPIHVGLE